MIGGQIVNVARTTATICSKCHEIFYDHTDLGLAISSLLRLWDVGVDI